MDVLLLDGRGFLCAAEHRYPVLWKPWSLREDVFDRPLEVITFLLPQIPECLVGHAVLRERDEDVSSDDGVLVV